MKGFSIYVKNDLLEEKHYQNMGEAIWLYLWLLDKMTSINENGIGRVLGNQPVTYTQLYVELGMPERTYQRYVSRLRKYGYINTLRTPRGLIFSVTKATKLFKRSAKNGVSHSPSDPPKSVPRSANLAPRSANMADANKDNTITKQGQNNSRSKIDQELAAKEQAAKHRASDETVKSVREMLTKIGIVKPTTKEGE